MSYILEALKKAEAERQQGAVPTLHAQAATLPAAGLDLPPSRLRLSLGIGTALVLAVLSALFWLRPWQALPSPPTAAPSMTVATATTVTTPAPAAASLAAPTPPPEPRLEPKLEPHPDPVIARPPPPAMHAPSKPKTHSAPAATKSVRAPTVVPATVTNIAPAGAPAVSIGGYLYSETPSERQLLVNKRLAHEGEEVAPGLVLEKMLPRAAVFNFQGHRYQVGY